MDTDLDTERERAPRVFVAGWCRRPGCGAPFTTIEAAASIRDGWPSTCSETCKRAMRRSRKAGRKAVAIRRCWVCWQRPVTLGLLCRQCAAMAGNWAKRMCKGKKRLGEQAARDRADSWTLTRGTAMSGYRCPVCGWAHTGNTVRDPGGAKRIALTVELWVRSLPAARLRQIRAGWEQQ